MKIGLIDSTLREGHQAYGVSFNLQQKKEIFLLLEQIGIEEIELGVVSRYDSKLGPFVRWCQEKSRRAKIALWSRCHREDILQARTFMPDVLSLSIPVSDLHIDTKLKKSRDWVLQKVSESLSLAKRLGFPSISLGLEDTTRADFQFLEKVCTVAEKNGADRIRLADTVGIATPHDIVTLIDHIKRIIRLPLGIHAHNDFGMATANSIMAFEAGASWADVTVLGIGERAGNARLEEVCGFLDIQRGKEYSISVLPILAGKVAAICRRTVSKDRPILGNLIFSCESGLHLQGLESDPRCYEPYPPELVGAVRKLGYGAKVGGKILRNHLQETTAADLDDQDIINITNKIRSIQEANGNILSSVDFSERVLKMAICRP